MNRRPHVRATRALLVAATGLLLALVLAACPEAPPDYEVWALDQGTDTIHIYDADLDEVDRIEFGDDVELPHMIHFDSEFRYAFVANPASGNVAVIDAEARELVDTVETGAGTHMATVAPDDAAVWVAVIGEQRFVEIPLDLDADDPVFEVDRTIDTADALADAPYDYPSAGAVCHWFTEDAAHAYLTFGPGPDEGGLVVVDVDAAEITEFFDPGEVRANCGVMLSANGEHMFANWGGDVGEDIEGEWYVFDAADHRLIHTASSQGVDAHGLMVTPDGEELWMVNRATSDGIVIDPDTFEVVDTIADTGPSPDILDFAPDGERAFVTLRGAEPLTGPHAIAGETPGFSVIDVTTREVVEVVEPAADDPDSDFHGIGVRILDR